MLDVDILNGFQRVVGFRFRVESNLSFGLQPRKVMWQKTCHGAIIFVVEAVMPQAIPRAESTHGRCEELRCCFL